MEKNKTNSFLDDLPYIKDIKEQCILILGESECRRGELIHITSTQEYNEDKLKELAVITSEYETISECIAKVDYAIDLYEISADMDDVENQIDDITKSSNFAIRIYKQYLFNKQFSDIKDRLNVIVAINAGSGGTESEDWTGMLFRMYCRWAANNDYDIEMLYELPSPEAPTGFKKIEFIISGRFVFGKLKNENGVHRLIRKSPFDKALRRHTSFASVKVTPEIDDTIVVDIDKNDVRVDTMRGHGAGGQHRNTTDSAVRMTHLPTGIVAFSQGERSQFRNREIAWKTLYSRIYEMEEEKRRIEIDGIIESNNAFGSQIRSYVHHPTQYVKDHRTGHQEYDFNKVLDGNIDSFIEELLKGA